MILNKQYFSKKINGFLFGSCLILFCLTSSTAYSLESPSKKLIDKSCLDCHDDDTQKGNLRLDNLASLKNDPSSMHNWLSIYDKVASGEMPPPKKAFSVEKKQNLLKALDSELRAFDQQKKKSTGRVVLRRLSASEYENAIRDLLHIPNLSVKQYLPADSKYHGIENVADRQLIAYNQIAQYLEAAETSLQAAVTLRPKPKTESKRYPASKLRASSKSFTNAYKLVEGKLVLIKEPALAQGPWVLFHSPSEPGYYKIRFKAHSARLKNKAFKSAAKKTAANLLPGKGEQTITLGVSLGRYLETFDLGPKSTVQECVVWLNGRERLCISCPDLPLRDTKFKSNKKPGIWDAVVLEWFEIEMVLKQWPPKGHQTLFGELPVNKWQKNSATLKPRIIAVGTGEKRRAVTEQGGPYTIESKNPAQDSQRLLKNFMTRAYRRPIEQDEVRVMQKRVLDALKQKICFQDAMLIAYKAILCSPDFLYIHESPGKLSSIELATRLSLYLWRSIPDERLMKVAMSGKLTSHKVLMAEAKRLIEDPKAKRFIDDFTNQWLDLEAIYATTPDKTLYPEYHEKYQLVESLVKETRAFIHEMVKSNLPIVNIVDADFTFLNESLADHYGIPGVKGSKMRKVKLAKNSVRGGILTQGSMMKISANGFTTSPIKRGVWVLERILGTRLPPPPADAGSIEPDTRGAITIRKQLDKHRQVKSCASCHKLIDPPGFALEAFDVMGAFRSQYRSMHKGKKKTLVKGLFRYDVRLGLPVDATGEFSGKKFTDIHSFKALLAKENRQIARNIINRLVTQATGAIPTYSDRQEIEALLNTTQKSGYRLKSLIARVILTSMFLEK